MTDMIAGGKLEAFLGKLCLWKRQLEKHNNKFLEGGRASSASQIGSRNLSKSYYGSNFNSDNPKKLISKLFWLRRTEAGYMDS
jgi:hypothetical protein